MTDPKLHCEPAAEPVKEPLYLDVIEKEYIWGTEVWVLSCHPQGPCTIRNEGYEGRTLRDQAWKEREFPLLIKLIDARESLSVQVHPGDSYAWAQEGSQGKTEMWYILDCEPGAFLYYGLKHKVTENEFRKRLKNGSILEICQKVPVKKGEVYFIPPGMLHAIGKGIRLAEVQQSSSITYRIYDYDREDANHNKRQLHVEQAVDVMGFVPAIGGHSPLGQREKRPGYSRILLAACEYFSVWSYKIESAMELPVADLCGHSPFVSVVVLRGEGVLSWRASAGGESSETPGAEDGMSKETAGGWNRQPLKAGDSIYLPGACHSVTIEGKMELLVSIPPEDKKCKTN